jgi:O-antigen ligase
LGLFAQGLAPASTFYNRNFFAEYAVCALPFSVWLLTHLRQSRWLVWFSLTLALNITAILMTGTRSALIALLVMLPVLAMISLRYRRALPLGQWSRTTMAAVLLVGLGASAVLGNLPTDNPRIAQELTGVSAWQRGAGRTASMAQTTEYTVGSFSVRSQMWRATLRMLVSHPLVGVGAGAWEANIPLFQNDDTTLEIDYYAHNEYLQLLSECCLVVGGLVLAFLGAYWIQSVL